MRACKLLFIFLFSCSYTWAQDSLPKINQQEERKVYPILYQQTAAEYRALCYQAYNIAELRVNAIPKRKLRRGKPAIITDLDETVLDNSYQEAQLIKDGKVYNNADWKRWSDKSVATGVPGSVAFLQYAAKKGITIFYISNRDTSELQSTLTNLKNLNLPNADLAHMLFMEKISSKETRRQIVMNKYHVVMLLGDNLNDFMNVFEKKPIAERFAETETQREEWGKKFIVLPNSCYGEWENALYDYERKLTPEQKLLKLRGKLTAY